MFSRAQLVPRGPKSMLIAFLVVCLVSVTLVLGPVSPAQAAGPFVCDGTPYTMQSGDLYKTVPDPANPGQYIAVLLSNATVGNSLAYDPTTNFLYAIKRTGGVNNRVFRVETYGNDAAVVNNQVMFPGPGQPAFPPVGSTATSYAGTALGDGRYVIGVWRGPTVNPADGNTYDDNLWEVNAATGEMTFIGPVIPQGPRHSDFSYNPADGYMYQAINMDLWRIDPLTGQQVEIGLVAGLPTGAFGSSWFSASGLLYVQRNSDGQIYEIDLGAMTATDVGATGATGGADGASCVGSLDLLKDVVDGMGNAVPLADRVYAPGGTVRYEFTLINNALPTGPRTLNLCDVLPADGRTYTGAWTVDPPTTVVNAATTPLAGSTSFCAAIDVPSSLFTDPATPGAPPVTFTVDVEIGANQAGGIVENQAWIDSDGNTATKEVLSDDPGDATDPEDPTTIEILSSFEVSKSISGHPVDNTTDSFTMTVSCVNSAGVAYDVPAANIVDATTGLPWSSAGTNSFDITDGEAVDVLANAGSTCTTTESTNASYSTWAITDSDGLNVSLPATPSSTIVLNAANEFVSFDNRTGSFTLYKRTFAPDGTPAAPLALTRNFVFTVSCKQGGVVVFGPTNYVIAPADVAGGGFDGSLSFPDTDLVPYNAECTVTETVPVGWEVITTPNPRTFTNDTADNRATFHNQPIVSDLTVTKTIEGLPPEADPADFTFEVTTTCSGGFATNPQVFGPDDLVAGTPLVIENLPAIATCQVVEAPTSAFGPSYSPAGGKVDITADGGQVDITNTTGTFIVQKFTQAPAGIDPTGDFDFSIRCDNGYTGTHTITADNPVLGGATGGLGYADLPLLPPGTVCQITESGPPTGWTLETAATVEITIPADGVRPTASFTNSRDVADLTITKVVVGDSAADPLNAQLFTVTVTCTGDFVDSPAEYTVEVSEDAPVTIAGLPTGATCQAVETVPPEFTSTVPDNGKVAITATGGAVEFTNSTSYFEITKRTQLTSTHPVENDATFTVDVRCDNGFSGTFELTTVDGSVTVTSPATPYLPPGTECEFAERSLAGWTAVGATSVTETTVAGAPVRVGFRNARDLVDLDLDKTIVGLPATATASDYNFTVDVSCAGGFEAGSDPHVLSDLPLVSGTTTTVAALPIGSVCTVVEDPTAAFSASYSTGGAATLTDSGGAVMVTNTTSTIAINKTTVIPAGSTIDPDDTFGFTVTCTATDWTGTVSILTVGGTGTVGFPTLPLLAPGTVCSIDETTIPTGWTPTATPLSITTVGGATTAADFTNTRDTAALTVLKTIDGLPATEDPATYDFTADISCTGDFSPNPRVLLDQPLNTATPLVIPDLPTGAVCTVTEDPDATFTPYYSPSPTTTIVAGGSGLGVLNATGEFIVLKHSLVADTHPIDPTANFTFQIRCTLGGTVTYDKSHVLESDTVTPDGSTGGISYGDLPSLAEGTECLITETATPAGWTIDTAPQTLTLSSTAPATAQFQNTRELGSLSISKSIDGLPASVLESGYSFTVDVVCNGGGLPSNYEPGPYTISGGETITIPDLPTGASCAVTERPSSLFTPSYDNSPAIIDTDGELVAITNATGTFDLSKTAVNPGALAVDLAATFSFGVVCSNGYSATHTVATNSAGTGTTTFPTIPLFAAGTTCDVTEQGPPAGWTRTSAATVPVSISTTDTPTAAFTNTRDIADLTITKTVVGLPAAASAADYTFTVDVVCNGGGLPVDYTPGPYTISDTGSVTIADLPTDATCVVAERADNRFAPTYTNNPATIDADGDTVAIVNATGTFDLAKTAQNLGTSPVDLVETFTFDVVCDNGYGDTHTVTTNVAGAGATVFPTIPLFAAGTSCDITEQTPPAGWTLASAATVTVAITAASTPEASFTNTRALADLDLTKTIVGLPANATAADFSFTVDVVCNGAGLPLNHAPGPYVIKDGETVTIPDLPTGAICTVAEQYSDEFTPSYVNNPATIDADGELVAITNSTGELILTKTATVTTTHPVDLTETFSFQVTCVDPTGATIYDQVVSFAVAPSGLNVATGGIRYDQLPLMPNGTACSMTEQTPPTGWTLASAPTVDVVIDRAAPQTGAFDNTRDVGDLTVTKTVLGLAASDLPANYSFVVDVVCNGGGLPVDYEPGPYTIAGGASITIDNLPTGATCVATEQADDRFAASYANNPATIDADGETLPVTNETGTFVLTKTALNLGGEIIDLSGTFTFSVSCTNGYAATHMIVTDADGVGGLPTPPIPLVAAGSTCSAAEDDPGLGWTPSADLSTVITTTSTPSLDFQNTRGIGDLSVSKTVEGLPADVNPLDFVFTVDVACSGGGLPAGYTAGPFTIQDGETISVPDLPTGAECSVVEQYSNQFTPTYINTPATIDLDGELVQITNSTGELIVSKIATIVSGHPVDLVETFDFEIVCVDPTGATVFDQIVPLTVAPSGLNAAAGGIRYNQLPLLPNGTACSVTEQTAPAGWTLASPGTLDVTIDDANPVTAEFVNTRDVGDVVLSKTVVGLPAAATAADYTFTVDVVCNGGGLPVDYEPGPFTVADGDTITIADLPTTATCSVVEQADDRFTPTYVNAPVAVDADGEAVSVTNATGTFDLVKTAVNPGAVDVDLAAIFTFSVDCDNGYSNTHTVSTATDGTGSTVFPTVPLFAAGTVCDVTEQTPPFGWTLGSAGTVMVTISETNTPEAAFTNTRDLGAIELTKTIQGLPASAVASDYSFVVDVVCNGGGLPVDFAPGPFTIGDGESIMINDLPTGAECVATEQYAEGFTPSYGNNPATVDTDGETVAIVNATGELIVAKTATITTDHPVDIETTFFFQVTCVDPTGATVHDEVEAVPVAVTTSAAGTIVATGGIRYDDLPIMANGTTCSVTEQGPATGWTRTSDETVDVVIDTTTPVTAAFTNVRDVGDLDITKVVLGLPAGEDPADYSFVVDVVCSSPDLPGGYAPGPYTITHGQTVTIPNLPTGAVCSVTEQYTDAFTATYVNTPTVIDTDGEVVAITNSTGELIVTKTAEITTGHPVDLTASFSFAVVCVDPTGATIYDEIKTVDVAPSAANTAMGGISYSDLPIMANGTVCDISEQGPPTGWTLATAPVVTVTIDSTSPQSALFTNTRDVGDLTLTKAVLGLPAGATAADYDFTLDVVCNGGGLPPNYTPGPFTVIDGDTIVVSELPTGAECLVSERADNRFTPTYTNTPTTIDIDGEQMDITNSTGSVEISKTALNPGTHPVDLADTFSFTLVCDNGYSGTHDITTDASGQASITFPVLPLLAEGTVCDVAETGLAAPWSGVITAGTFTASAADVAEVSLVNQHLVGDLTLAKGIVGLPAGADPRDFTFTLDVVCEGGNLPVAYAPGPITIQHGENVVIEDLPIGAVCVVTEQNALGFTASYNNNGATIDEDGERIGVINATGELIVSKMATVDSAHPIDLNASFAFAIECIDPTGAVVFDQIETFDVAPLTATTAGGGIGYDRLPIMADGTICSVTEVGPPAGWTLASAATVTVTIDNALPAAAEFDNTRDVADLEITKTVYGLPAGSAPEDYTFTIDVVCNGGGLPADYAPGPYSIVHGTPVVVDNLPTGATCAVEEQPTSGFTPNYVNTPTTIDADGEVVGITNATGELIILKVASISSTHPVDLTATFNFAIECTNTVGVVVFDDVLPVTVAQSAPTTASGGVTYSDLPIMPDGSECVITEQPAPTGWTRTSAEAVTVEIQSLAPVTAVFNNERDVANLDLTKVVTGLPSAAADTDVFSLNVICNGGGLPADYTPGPFTIADGETVTIADLPTSASCAVTEDADDRYTPTIVTSPTVIGDGGARVEVTNATGTFTLAKSAVNAGAHPVDLAGTFTFSVTCDNGYAGSHTVDTDSAGAGSISHPELPILAAGTTCTVTEDDAPVGWAGDSSVETVVITSDSTPTAAFTNDRSLGDIAITKTIAGLPAADDATTYTFIVDVVCNGGGLPADYDAGPVTIAVGSPATITDLPTGASCVAIEQDDNRFASAASPANATAVVVPATNVPGPGPGAPGTPVPLPTIEFTNSTGTIQLDKLTSAAGTFPITLGGSFAFNVTCTNGYVGTHIVTTDAAGEGTVGWPTLPLLATGTDCDVTEADIPANWSLASALTQSVAVPVGPATAITFRNERNTADLTVSKTVVGEDAVLGETFLVDITCTGDFAGGTLTLLGQPVSASSPIVVPNLPTGATCVAVEQEDLRFSTSYVPAGVAGSGSAGSEVTIMDTGAAISILNQSGSLAVVKHTTTTDAHPVDPSGVFTFQVVCIAGGVTLHDASHDIVVAATSATAGLGVLDAAELPTLPDGATCEITETGGPDGWTAVGDTTQFVTLSAGAPAMVEFTNDRDDASLTITKAIDGLPIGLAAAEFDTEFVFELTCTGGDLLVDPYVLSGLIATVNTPAVIEDLPTGATCSAIEAPNAKFFPIYDDPVVITEGGATWQTVNSAGSLIISKYAQIESTHPIVNDLSFDFAIRCTGPDGTSVFDQSLAAVMDTPVIDGVVGGINYDRLPPLPSGSTCAIEEINLPEHWTVVGDNAVSLDISAGVLPTASFTNRRDIGDLQVAKTVTDVDPEADVYLDRFIVDITCTGGFTITNYDLTEMISTDNAALIEALPAGAECTITEQDDPRFASTISPATITIVDGQIAEVSVENRRLTGSVQITKDITGIPDDIDLSGVAYPFRVTCQGDFADGMTEIPVAVAAGETAVVDGLPLGSTCVVTEDADERFVVSFVPMDATVEVTTGDDEVVALNTWVAVSGGGGTGTQPTATPIPPTPTATTVPPTATATATAVPPTATATTVPPTATATATAVPPTATTTPEPTATATAVPPTAVIAAATATAIPAVPATATAIPPTATPIPVPLAVTAPPPPELAVTGTESRPLARWGALALFAGVFIVLATRRREDEPLR